jgi:Uma2 family endonuclease
MKFLRRRRQRRRRFLSAVTSRSGSPAPPFSLRPRFRYNVDEMNVNTPTLPPTTTAAEGLPRRRFTVAELEQMVAAGILHEDERIELIGGEVVPMSPKGRRHEIVKAALNLHWARALPPDLLFVTETTFRLSPDTYLEPDFVFYPKVGGWSGLNAETARLVVEVADSSLAYDLGQKANLYAGFGIAELWVIDAVKLVTRIHRDPASDGYRSIVDLPSDQRLVPSTAPPLAVALSALDLR